MDVQPRLKGRREILCEIRKYIIFAVLHFKYTSIYPFTNKVVKFEVLMVNRLIC